MQYTHKNRIVEDTYTTDIKEELHTFEVKLTVDYDDDYIGHANVKVIDTICTPNTVAHLELMNIDASNLKSAVALLTDFVNYKLTEFFDHEI